MSSYDFIEDPGHGWLKVPRKKLEQLGLLDKISSYSFQRGVFVYLEEDNDAPLFVQAVVAKGGAVLTRRRVSNSESRIRNYRSYTP